VYGKETKGRRKKSDEELQRERQEKQDKAKEKEIAYGANRKDGKPDRRTTPRFKRQGGRKGVLFVDWDRVDELLECGCTGEEIAACFGMAAQTFYNKVSEKYQMHFISYRQMMKAKGESLLREQQFKKALGLSQLGDNTLLIWLGKQRLGQSETHQDQSINEEALKNFNLLIEQLNSLQKKN